MIKACNTYSLNDLPLGTKGRVIALGMFDGLHSGHMDIIKKAVMTAERDGLTSTVQTFKNLFKQDSKTLYTPAERLKLVSQTGADELLVLDFDEVKDMEPEEYLRNILLYRCVADTLIMGEDYRFGKDAKGDVAMIKAFAKENDIRVIVVKDHLLEGTDKKISTTWLRDALAEGDDHSTIGKLRVRRRSCKRPVRRKRLRLFRQMRSGQTDGQADGIPDSQYRCA